MVKVRVQKSECELFVSLCLCLRYPPLSQAEAVRALSRLSA
jgi:hypothetical protein